MPVSAYVMMEVSAGKTAEVLREIKNSKGVKTAYAVTGPYDIIAFVEADTYKDLTGLVMNSFHKIDGVNRTLTCNTVEIS